MAWTDTKQAAVDPDNPAANEQIPFSEWNAMVDEEWNKLIGRLVDAVAIGNDKILVYKSATNSFVFESPSMSGALDDISDVTISGVPSNDELLAYNAATSQWINQTAAEAGIATAAELAMHLPLAGGTLTGPLTCNGQLDMVASIAMNHHAITECTGISSAIGVFSIFDILNLGAHRIENVSDPVYVQDASTKNYADNRLFTKEAVTSFLDGYIPVYRTASGKFEMEVGGGSAGLPVIDTTAIVHGSSDGTKMMRFEVDGITTGTTRVMTIPDKNITLADKAEVLLLSGGTMAGALDMNFNEMNGARVVRGLGTTNALHLFSGTSANTAYISIYGDYGGSHGGEMHFSVPSAGSTASLKAAEIGGMTDNPKFNIYYGLNMHAKDIDDVGGLILNDATELTIASGVVHVTQSYHSIDTEADAATDDLDMITGGVPGQILTIRAIDSTHTIVAKDGTVNLRLEGDMSLDNAQDTLSLIYDGTDWLETSRSNNSA